MDTRWIPTHTYIGTPPYTEEVRKEEEITNGEEDEWEGVRGGLFCIGV